MKKLFAALMLVVFAFTVGAASIPTNNPVAGNNTGLLDSGKITNQDNVVFGGHILGTLSINATSIVTVAYGHDSESDDYPSGAHIGIIADMLRQWQTRYGRAGTLNMGTSFPRNHNYDVRTNLTTRVALNSIVDDSLVVLLNDGLDAWYDQGERISPGPVWGSGVQDQNQIHINPNQFQTPINEWGVRFVSNTNAGIVKITHTNEFGSEVIFVNCRNAMNQSVTNAVLYTNFFMGAYSTNNHWEFLGLTNNSGGNSTNIILALEALDVSHGGIATFHWGQAGTGLSQWLASDTTYPGLLYNLFKSVSPSASIFISKHLSTLPTVPRPTSLTNDLISILTYMHGGYLPDGQFTNNATKNNFTAVIGGFATEPDPGYVGSADDVVFVRNTMNKYLPGGGTNYFLVDLVAGLTNAPYIRDSLDVQSLHPSTNGNWWATAANRKLGMDASMWRSGSYGLRGTIPITPTTALSVFDGKVLGTVPPFSSAVNSTLWVDGTVTNVVFSSTNITSVKGVTGVVLTGFGECNQNGGNMGLFTNAINGYNALWFNGLFPLAAGVYNCGFERTNLVDPVNLTDTTFVMVAKTLAAGSSTIDNVFYTTDDSGNSYSVQLNNQDGKISAVVGTNSVLSVTQDTTSWAIYRFQRTGTNLVIARNGVVIASKVVGGITLNPGTSQNTQFGGNFGVQSWAEFKLWNRSLNLAEIYNEEHRLSAKFAIPLADGIAGLSVPIGSIFGLSDALNQLAPTNAPTIFNGNNIGTFSSSGKISADSLTITNNMQSATLTTTGNAIVGGTMTNANLSVTGTMLGYHGDTGVGNGISYNVGRMALTGQTASVGTTTLYTTTAAGEFSINPYWACTTAGSAGTLTVTLNWTDENGAQTFTLASSFSLSVKASPAPAPPRVIHCASGTTITASTTVAGATGSPQYEVFISVLRL